MTTNRDTEAMLDAWLAEGFDVANDRVLDVVEDRISHLRQRPAWRVSGRDNHVNRTFKLAIGIAAGLVVAVVAYSLLPDTTGPSAPTATPTSSAPPTAEATPTPSAGARFPAWFPPTAVNDANGAGILPAGDQATRVFNPAFTYNAPDGWVNTYDEPGYFTLFPDTPANQAEFRRSENMAQTVLMGIQPKPWFTCESLENNRGATAAEIVAAMATNQVLAISDPVDATIGGLTGKRVDVRRSPDWTGTCPADSNLPPGLDPSEERTRAIILDVPGRGVLVIFLYSISSAGFEPFLAEGMPIIESLEFSLTP